jgi:hypothetical protein
VWGSFKEVPVIAADLKLQEILVSDFPELGTLGEREVIVGKTVAQNLNIKAGDQVHLKTEFGNLVGSQFEGDFAVKAVSNLGVWNGAILSSLEHADSILNQVEFVPNQIWKRDVLSYVFVTGPERWLFETKQLVDKRTVAQDLRLSQEVPALLKLSGIDEGLEFEVLIFALLSSVISLFAFLAIWIPLLSRTYRKLVRSGYSTHQLLLTFQALGLFLLVLAAGLSVLVTHFHPII